ncbi:hypothetical protein BRADI_1g58746v3, partial [Brachypodium distachyon]
FFTLIPRVKTRQTNMNSNMASKILVVFFLILQASLMFIAQDVLAARNLAKKSGALDCVESGGANAKSSSYQGSWSPNSGGYGKPGH